LKLIIILAVIILVLVPTGIWVFAGIFFGLIYYTYRKQNQTNFYKQNEYNKTTLEEMS